MSDIQKDISTLNDDGILTVNIGLELAIKLSAAKQSKFLNLEVQEHLQFIIENGARLVIKGKPKIIAIFNLGILLEPSLRLDASKILTELSKTIAIIIIWGNNISQDNRLYWSDWQEKHSFNFNNINLKQIYL